MRGDEAVRASGHAPTSCCLTTSWGRRCRSGRRTRKQPWIVGLLLSLLALSDCVPRVPPRTAVYRHLPFVPPRPVHHTDVCQGAVGEADGRQPQRAWGGRARRRRRHGGGGVAGAGAPRAGPGACVGRGVCVHGLRCACVVMWVVRGVCEEEGPLHVLRAAWCALSFGRLHQAANRSLAWLRARRAGALWCLALAWASPGTSCMPRSHALPPFPPTPLPAWPLPPHPIPHPHPPHLSPHQPPLPLPPPCPAPRA